MPRIPTYRLHTSTGQALVELNGHRHYLGKHGSPESRQAYDRLVAEFLAGGRSSANRPGESILVVELIARFREWAEGYYRRRDGTQTKTIHDVQSALRIVRELYGRTPVESFTPNCLHTVQSAYVRKGCNRATVNSRVNWVRRLFKWGVARELVKAPTWQALLAVEPLKAGRSEAREPGRVLPVPEDTIHAIKPFVNRHIWGLLQLQRLTGARGGELLKIRAIDLDMQGQVWKYSPNDHKNAYRGQARTIFIGPKAQEVLREFLVNRPLDAFLFSPQVAESERQAARHAARKTPLSYGNQPGTNRMSDPQRRPHDHYSSLSYAKAVQRACDAAFPPPAHLARQTIPSPRRRRWESHSEWKARLGKQKWQELMEWQHSHRWHPHQLRHNAATELRRQFGIEAARLILGHRTPTMTEQYAERDFDNAARIIQQVG